jgi:hypothetical protein
LTISDIRFAGPHAELTAVELLDLSIRSWGRGTEEMIPALEYAIGCTQNFTARSDKTLVGCARLLSDGFFATVPEILVDKALPRQGNWAGTHERTSATCTNTPRFWDTAR